MNPRIKNLTGRQFGELRVVRAAMPARTKREKHKQVEMLIRGQLIRIDQGVKNLVLLMNKLPGIETYNSCQGSDNNSGFPDDGYIQFGGENCLLLLPFLALEIEYQQQKWQRRHQHECRGCYAMTVELTVSGHTGMGLTWSKRDYPVASAIIKQAARHFKKMPGISSQRSCGI